MTAEATPVRLAEDHRTVVDAPDLLSEFNRAGVVDPIDVHAATDIGETFAETDPTVLLAAALAVRGTRYGHVCIDISTVQESVAIDGVPANVVDALEWPDPNAWQAAVAASRLTGDGTPVRPLVLHGSLLYLERYWAYEEIVAMQLLDRISTEPATQETLRETLQKFFPGDADFQRLAAAMAATGRLTVIGGGPGTGKTYTISRLLGVLFDHARSNGNPDPVIAVAAPTGKAAARLTEQIRAFASNPVTSEEIRGKVAAVEASTLHRLLGWHPQRGRFRHAADDPLPHDTVIVDEMSMVSLPMTAKLLDAVHPDSRLILVGDPDQLVSIEAGTVLGDLAGPGAHGLRLSSEAALRLSEITGDTHTPHSETRGMGDHVVTLDRAFRFEAESGLANLADAIRRGGSEEAMTILQAGSDGVRWFDTEVISIEEIPEVTDLLIDHADRLVQFGAEGAATSALDQLGRLALLCAHRRGEFGVAHWVPWIEKHSRVANLQWEGGRWYPGRPSMVTTNDYRLGVFNGDIGVTVRDGDRLAVAFESADGVRLIGPAQLPSAEAVHAMTIHKSQGSQFERVIVLVPGEGSRLLTRELLYTAVTRARSEVVLVGTEPAIRSAIARQVARSSGLAAKLWGPSRAEQGED